MTRPRYRLELEALPGDHPDRRLARGLKYLLRACGFRCRHVALVKEDTDADTR
jgi:hypothetical protein